MRRFLLTVLAGVALAVSAQSPKYIFYFIGDGMGMGPVMSALNYKRLVKPQEEPLLMTSLPVVSFCQTWSASTPVTDSAAAGTALATSHKTRNGMLGMDADTVSVNSVAKYLKDEGWGVALLTTVAPDDATPAAFYAHVPSRKMFYDIDIQVANSNYDFIAGSALRGLKDKDGNPTDVMDVLASNGYKVVYGPEGMATISDTQKVILLGNPEINGNESNVSYTIDSIPGALNLPDMTRAALEHLLRVSPDKFFMMVEGGNIDHALHANDGGAATKEVINFDSAIAVAYQFYLQHPDETLIVITADHDTGGLTVGNRTLSYNARLEYIDSQKVSKEEFSKYCKTLVKENAPAPQWQTMRDYLAENLGFWKVVPVTDKQTQMLKNEFEDMVNKKHEDQKSLYASFDKFAVTVFRLFNDAAGYGFTTGSHTGNPVPVFAVGRDADNFKALNNNVDIPDILLKVAVGKNLK